MSAIWKYWINEPIFVNGGVHNIMKRKHIIYYFVKEGLIPFIHNVGYRFIYEDKEVFHRFLSVLFAYHQKKRIQFLPQEGDYLEEQYQLYCDTINTTDWEHFWNIWKEIQDFQDDAFGSRIQYILSEIVWSWIDLQHSERAMELADELDELEQEEEYTKGKDDPYLQEHSKRDYQDRHW